MFLIAALTVSLNIGKVLQKNVPVVEPKPTCHVRVVSHKFVGQPTSVFTFAGEQYEIPATGWIELISEKHVDTYEYNGRTLPLKVFPLDAFGTETIHLPKKMVYQNGAHDGRAMFSSSEPARSGSDD